MSPEQAANEPLDGRSDLYALGVVGYLATSGRLPFETSNLPALLVRQATQTPASVALAAPGIPSALSAVIDRCLARNRDERFPDGEAMAAALAPAPDTRPALPPTLRAWLGTRNPLELPYFAWSGFFTTAATANLIAWLTGNVGSSAIDVVLLVGTASAPLLPLVGFHVNQARRQFRAGHTLADLRTALEVDRRERAEGHALAQADAEALSHRVLRYGTIASAAWLAATLGLLTERQFPAIYVLVPMLTTGLLGAVSNALDVQFIPTRMRTWWQTGIRDRLWNSRVGDWFARKLGAPEKSRAVSAGAFRATEAALGVAASDLFAALPQNFRAQLAELPATVAALEARAAEARAEMEVVAALHAPGAANADAFAARRQRAAAQLSESVAALEGIRLDLLRLHAGASDLAPLTTLIDAARVIGEDVRRLADAQREVDASLMRATPAGGAQRD